MKIQIDESGVTPVLETLLLLIISLIIFSLLFTFTVFQQPNDESPIADIIGTAIYENSNYGKNINLTLIHLGGESINIKSKMKHRVKAVEDTYILETSTPELDDVVRLEDKYNRKCLK